MNLDCPFCGGTAGASIGGYTKCLNSSCPLSDDEHPVEWWNKRAETKKEKIMKKALVAIEFYHQKEIHGDHIYTQTGVVARKALKEIEE